ncbi:MAG TPA: tRNA uridine-5-carboxymethylaminomethyl(34) synthesis GTPase MnmE [Gammaproteobacteria bacterium]
MNQPADTIAAIATPPGKGGIGIVRISGPRVSEIMQALFHKQLSPRRAELLPFKNTAGETLDRGIALFFEAPHSYTGEDVLELQGHVGPVVLNLLLQRILELGARLAGPGEFTERAFLNDKMDLAQAEAVIDLIESSSEQGVKAAARSLEGAFSGDVQRLLAKLKHVRMYIEAALDFPEEEIDFLSDAHLHKNVAGLCGEIDSVLESAHQGRLLKEGLSIVILGRPNAGKSSLLNRLAGRDSAIVTEFPGTTRDVLREHIHIDGLPLHIIDTAGLRDSDDPIEQEGVKRAWKEVEKADRVLLLVDNRLGLGPVEERILERIPAMLPVDIIHNKLDLHGEKPFLSKTPRGVVAGLSVKTGEGWQLLTDHLKKSVGYEQTAENQYSARRRHIEALKTVKICVNGAQQRLMEGAGELAAEELRLAQEALSRVTGEFSSDDLLGEIFSNFCIGK